MANYALVESTLEVATVIGEYSTNEAIFRRVNFRWK